MAKKIMKSPKLWRLSGSSLMAYAHTKSEARARLKATLRQRAGNRVSRLPAGSEVCLDGEQEYDGYLRGLYVRAVRVAINAGRSFQLAARTAHVAIASVTLDPA